MKKLVIVVLLVTTLCPFLFGLSQKPLSRPELFSLLTGGVSVERIIEIVKDRGIDFVPDEECLSEIRKVSETLAELLKVTIQPVDCSKYEDWHGRYQWGDGCPLWNEMVRSNESVIAVVKASPETYVMFPRPGAFVMLVLAYDSTGFFFGGYISQNGSQPQGIEIDTWHKPLPDAVYVIHDDTGFVWHNSKTGIREIALTPDELIYVQGIKPFIYKQTISRSTGRYRNEFLPPEEGRKPEYGKAAIYHHGVLQP